jgi:NAD(P)H-dependent FMN reductase
MRQGSYNTQVLNMVLEELKKYKTDTQIFELLQVNLPIYDPSASNESSNNTIR